MFERCDTSLSVGDKEYKERIKPLGERLGVLQRRFRDEGIPVIILIEGWNASGISGVVTETIRHLDARGFSFHSFGKPCEEEKDRPLLWRFWVKSPAAGRIAIFARGWMSRSLAEEATGIGWETDLARSLSSIRTFERLLADDGTVFVKIFLHITREEQKRRLDERERGRFTSWLVTRGDWDFHRHYDRYLPVIERLIRETDTPPAPWTVIGANDPNFAALEVVSAIVGRMEQRLASAPTLPAAGTARPAPTDLRKVDLARSLSGEKYRDLLPLCQGRLRELQALLFKRKVPLIVLYEGWDAAGKGGNIRRLTQPLNPRGFDVVPVGAPSDIEKKHHHLWRFVREFPRAGQITVFDRSWYGRVLVERVEGLCSEAEWRRAYDEINEIESWWTESGGLLVKFWLEIDPGKQLDRFTRREQDPLKQWKVTDEDWRNREKWDDYAAAVDEMLLRTHTRAAPWTVVPSNDKNYSRIHAYRTVIEHIEKGL
jgi:AMP-polyphosphate phosphotransferase